MSDGREPADGASHGFQPARHLPALDGLRALAIAGVVWHHSLPCAYPGWLGRGHAGVPLFFALSGFLITLLACNEQRLTGRFALGPFWMRRCLRIAPLYYLVLAGFCVFLWCSEPTDATRHFFQNLSFYATYTSNWFVDFDVSHPIWFGFAWSLATEEQFYLWWPPLLALAGLRRRWLAALGLGAVLGLDQLVEHGLLARWLPAGSSASRIAQSSSAGMLLGALLALALASPRGFALGRRVLANRHATALAALLAGAWLWRPFWPALWLDLAFVALVGAAALSSGQSLVERALRARPLLHVGRVSYGMYLFHIPVLGLTKHLLPALAEQPVLLFPLVFALSTGVATLSYRYLEGPLLALKQRFRPLPDAPGEPAAQGMAPAAVRWTPAAAPTGSAEPFQ